MPDTITTDTKISNRRPRRQGAAAAFLDASQMRALWQAADQAMKNYSEVEPDTADVMNAALDRLAKARTVDPQGICYKLLATRTWADMERGLTEDLRSGDRNERIIASIIRDVTAGAVTPAAPAPHSPTAFARALATAALPYTDEFGGIKDHGGLAEALTPIIGRFTIADAVGAIGALRTTAEVIRGEDAIDNALFAVVTMLEMFCCYASAADAESVAARVHLIEKAASTPGWELGNDMEHATRAAAWDIRALRSGNFEDYGRGTTFAADPRERCTWVYHLIGDQEGLTAARDYADSRTQAQQEAVGA